MSIDFQPWWITMCYYQFLSIIIKHIDPDTTF